MKCRRLCFVLLAVLVGQTVSGASLVVAQQNWEKTPYRSWSAPDVKAVLEASPWSRVIEYDTALAPSIFGAGAPKISERMVVLLRSAMPVRQALLRERQLAHKYDGMSAAEREAFDAKNKTLLDCPACAKYYVVSVKCFHVCYSGSFIEDYKKSFYLVNDKGERRELAGASPLPDKQEGAVFFFPRLDDKGEPLLTAGSREVTFHFMLRAIENLNSASQKYKFDVTKMVRSGEVVF